MSLEVGKFIFKLFGLRKTFLNKNGFFIQIDKSNGMQLIKFIFNLKSIKLNLPFSEINRILGLYVFVILLYSPTFLLITKLLKKELPVL